MSLKSGSPKYLGRVFHDRRFRAHVLAGERKDLEVAKAAVEAALRKLGAA